jgi:hypothetical protein
MWSSEPHRRAESTRPTDGDTERQIRPLPKGATLLVPYGIAGLGALSRRREMSAWQFGWVGRVRHSCKRKLAHNEPASMIFYRFRRARRRNRLSTCLGAGHRFLRFPMPLLAVSAPAVVYCGFKEGQFRGRQGP